MGEQCRQPLHHLFWLLQEQALRFPRAHPKQKGCCWDAGPRRGGKKATSLNPRGERWKYQQRELGKPAAGTVRGLCHSPGAATCHQPSSSPPMLPAAPITHSPMAPAGSQPPLPAFKPPQWIRAGLPRWICIRYRQHFVPYPCPLACALPSVTTVPSRSPRGQPCCPPPASTPCSPCLSQGPGAFIKLLASCFKLNNKLHVTLRRCLLKPIGVGSALRRHLNY